ncbi:ribonuclease P protein subunit p29 [Orussus abietinus]|uniref:ribonuclease P protein subunit p29 n=1 Tax=Orussus abietinus TaxID=222816 RepID=UPI0006257023|nr:ribonuclease P protein subunit p29 [Orussus abietinus]
MSNSDSKTSGMSIYTPLPVTVIGQTNTSERRIQYLENFLESTLPTSDVKGIGQELRKSFILAKHKPKGFIKKQPKPSILPRKKRALINITKRLKSKGLKYENFIPLNDLWLGYMKRMLCTNTFLKLPKSPIEPGWEAVNQKIMKADFHGAAIKVIRSKCPSLVKASGIVLQDTKGTFKIIGKDNIVRVIPKETVVFQIKLKEVALQVFGKDLCIRPAERAVKKFKNLHVPIL